MVVGERDVHHWPDYHLAIDGDRPVLRLVQAEYADLRVIDDRRGNEGAEHTTVGDRERAAGEIVHRQLAVTRALGDFRDLPAQINSALAIRVLVVAPDE